jgi:hypothetical protein
MYWQEKNKKWLFVLLAVVVAICALFVFFVSIKIDGNWRGIPPSLVDDDVYYFARMNDIAEGHPFLGNPYFLEYRNSISPAFFIPDWISAVPLLLKIPLVPSLIFNFVFWSVLFSILLYYFIREYDIPLPVCALITVFSFLEVFWLILRPVSMQVIFPFYLFFLISLILWLKNPASLKRSSLLVISSTLTFYVYTYLWQIVFTILGLFFLYFLYRKEWKKARDILYIGLFTLVLSVPVIVLTVQQIGQAFYLETITRIGLINSHLPTIYSYQYGRWIAVLLIAFYLLKNLSRNKQNNIRSETDRRACDLVLVFSGLSLLIMCLSNIITGKDLETALHIGRFITLWVAIYFPMIIWYWLIDNRNLLQDYKRVIREGRYVILVFFGLLCLLAAFLASNINRSLPISRVNSTDFKFVQDYAEPISWLKNHKKEPVSVWADETMSAYIPLMSEHYVLWNHLGALHLISNADATDRFLVSWIGTSTPEDELVYNYRSYIGAGAIWKYTDEYYKNKLSCFFGLSCREDQTLNQWIGKDFINNLKNRQIVLKKDLREVLHNYSVLYVIADKSQNEDKYFDTLKFLKNVWSNERFIIYEIN